MWDVIKYREMMKKCNKNQRRSISNAFFSQIRMLTTDATCANTVARINCMHVRNSHTLEREIEHEIPLHIIRLQSAEHAK